jgi:F-type H+-transporting ATPase subunit a
MDHGFLLLPTFGLKVHTAYMIYVFLTLCVVSYILKGRLKIVPGKLQSVVEIIVEAFLKLSDDIMGPKGKKFVPFVLTFFIFILVSNAFGLFPGLSPPTANVNTTIALALIVFVSTHIIGFKEHGISYLKHFLGPHIHWVMTPFMLVLELIGHLVRPVSLSMRLFGNIFGHETVVIVLLILMPLAYPILALVTVLGVLVVVIQAFVFALLTMTYFSGALEEAH